MVTQSTQTIIREQPFAEFAANCDGDQERLNLILAANAQIEREEERFKNYQEQFEAKLMRNPFSVEKSFAYFGFLLGLFPPAAIFYQLIKNNAEPGIATFFLSVNLVCAASGYFSGRLIGKMVSTAEDYSWNKMLLLLPLIGIFWGLIAGGIGGAFIFVIGAFFGGIIAAIIGSLAVPVFTIFHRLLKRGEMIDRKHFLPLAFGVALAISAFIAGL